jgi:hypothetical protein
MVRHPLRLWLTAITLAGALAGCSRPIAEPAPTLAGGQATVPVAATEALLIASPVATDAPAPTAAAATEAPAQQHATALPTAAPIAGSQGSAVLRLAPGSGQGQVGIAPDPNDASLMRGPSSFRIGADNSIRVLDRINKRILFFDQQGALARTQPVAEAADPIDFIVNTRGETFVYDAGIVPEPGALRENAQVLTYDPTGTLASSFPINPQVFASGIMLTSAQDLVLVGGSFGDNALVATVLHDGKPVAPEHQLLTLKRGMPSPRSAVLFSTSEHAGGTTDLSIGVVTGESGLILSNLPVPAGARFLNIDRALNLYFVQEAPGAATLNVWQIDTTGALVGGATVDFANCQQYDWRSVYVAQDGALWSMCSTAAGTAITRYDVVSPEGQPVPQAAASPPDGIPWGSGGPNLAA